MTFLKRCHPLTVYAVQQLHYVRWLGCVRMVSTRCATSELQLRALREVATRERQVGTDAENLVARRRSTRKRTVACSLGRAGIRFGEGGWQLNRRRSREIMLNPCPWARGSKTTNNANAEISLASLVYFLPARANKEQHLGFFFEAFLFRLRAGGRLLARRLHQLKAFIAMDFLYLGMMRRGLEKEHGLLDKGKRRTICSLCC